ncbi:hypothetical protein COCSUDRAFT_39831 [Coccomyxa subellipsoidea C-169]|uniref:EGF-like domain-containing protein n=1 Tax=Coccomyxa subellipsoidea (strain C-169) TaxID=574566 RepID=I0Z886_COCSC|nr:hypothetical protein COCSUDRAFT_39831 [Coccomyxa subellipsoidea C-169]EIE26855.1 hypothetical protein COCSUDRAFT_39831 [Coccomyxa subellipsoidea C-169]|eukprot:XP_005651399.1 hypothetical protein COCSUDRAFT_39831 [Coccomyxa subellipsoidea C-169]
MQSQAKQLDTATFGYDFRETSSSSHESVVKKVKKSDISATFDHQGVYLCVKAYGEANLTYSLRATLSQCPADFNKEGEQLLCSSPLNGPASEQRYSQCLSDGTCACKPPYNKPIEDVYPLLGFEDCSAKTDSVTAAELSLAKPYIKEHEELAPKAWSFYGFDITPDDYQIVINVATEAGGPDDACAEEGFFGLFAKFGKPPGWRYGEWDFRPDWDYFGAEDDELEIRLDATKEAWQTGRWFVGVNGDDAHTCNYTLSISKYNCPMNCSNRGTCVSAANGTRSCDCFKAGTSAHGFFGEDCSNEAEHLQYGVPVIKPESNFEYDFFQLPEISPAMLTHSVEGDLHSEPHTANYTFKQVMQLQNTTYEIDLCPSQLKQGVWRAAIYNPMRIYKLAYNLTTVKEGRCLNNCTGHGTCSDDAVCHCLDNWTGGDCSVYARGGSCSPGSRKPTLIPEAHGTCWHECRCDAAGNCAYSENECADFTCESALWRRQGTANACVLDKCKKDLWEETDSHSCLKPCVCPADGSACAPAAACDATHFSCKAGWRRFSDGQAKCFQPGCQAGSLHEAVGRSVANGQAYAVCTCTGEEKEGQPSCTVGAGEDAAFVVSCNEGYMLKGASSVPGSGVRVGGSCAMAGKRGSVVAAIFLNLFEILVSGVAGAGALWLYENRFRRSTVNAALYHELSMDTGF